MSEIRRYACFDADKTIIPGFSILPVFDAMASEGYITGYENGMVRQPNDFYERELLDYQIFFKSTLSVAAFVLKGKDTVSADQIACSYFKNNVAWFGYVDPTIDSLREQGVEPVLVTDEPQFIANGITLAKDFKMSASSEFTEVEGIFTGEIKKVLDSKQKAKYLRKLQEQGSVTHAFGDSEGDIGMLSLANEAFCIDPTPGLRTVATNHGWQVVDNPDQKVSLV